MLLLRCAIVGQRTVFTMDADDNRMVGIFMNYLQSMREFDFTPCMMRLYIAQPIDDPHNAWLQTSHADYEALARADKRVTAAYVHVDRVMRGAYRLGDYFPCQPDEYVQNIHVLIKLPTDEELASPPPWAIGCHRPEKAETRSTGPERGTKSMRRGGDGVDDDCCFGPAVGPLDEWIIALRESVASLAAWIASSNEDKDAGVDAEKQKSKAA